MNTCSPVPRVHRHCFNDWPQREAFARALFEQFVTIERGYLATFYRSQFVAAALGVRSDNLDDAVVCMRHVQALDAVVIPLGAWEDWLSRRDPTWDRSGYVDDLALFATEVAALRASYPSAQLVAASEPVRTLLARVAVHKVRAALDKARERNKTLALQHENVRARAIADQLGERPLPCPHCAALLVDVRFIDGGDRDRAFFICHVCGRSFRPPDLEHAT